MIRADLITGMTGHVGPQRIIGVLWAYFDESGKLADSDFICICGYLWDEAANKFASEWRRELLRLQIPFLHTTALLARRDPYVGLNWTESQSDKALIGLAKIIKRNALVGFGFAVDAKHFRQMPRKDRILIGGRNPEIFIFHRLLRTIVDVLGELNYSGPISLIFDWEEDYAKRCLGALAYLRKHREGARRVIASIGFADDVVFPPLQAADMLAFATKRHFEGNSISYWGTLMGEFPDGVPPPHCRSENYDATELDDLPRRFREGLERML